MRLRRPLLGIVLLFATIAAVAAGEPGTFDAVYSKSWTPNWWLLGLSTLVTAALVAISGGTGGPIVAGIGTWIGNALGFSGAAATNAGLALLGGGSLASGGFGMAGGAIVLTAALSFSGDLAADYAFDQATRAYSPDATLKAAQSMAMLPLPIADGQSDGSKAAMEVVRKIAKRVNEDGARVDRDAKSELAAVIQRLDAFVSQSQLTPQQLVGDQSLLALLAFICDDVPLANRAAQDARRVGREAGLTPTLPAFILATSMLVSERSPDFAASLKLLSEAIGANNGDERFRPAMVAVYMDRLAYRLQEYETSLEWLDRLYWVVDGVPFAKRSAALRMQVIPQYFQQLKREQQDILVLANTTNETIRNAPQTLVDMRLSLSRYEALLASARRVLEDSGDQVQRSMEDRLLWKRGWEKELAATIKQLRASLDQYESDLPRLKRKVEWFEFSQSGMPPQWVVVGAVLIAGGLVGFLVWRRRRGPTDRSENGTAA